MVQTLFGHRIARRINFFSNFDHVLSAETPGSWLSSQALGVSSIDQSPFPHQKRPHVAAFRFLAARWHSRILAPTAETACPT